MLVKNVEEPPQLDSGEAPERVRTRTLESAGRHPDEDLGAIPARPARHSVALRVLPQKRAELALGQERRLVHRARDRGVEAPAREGRVGVGLGARVRDDHVVELETLR